MSIASLSYTGRTHSERHPRHLRIPYNQLFLEMALIIALNMVEGPYSFPKAYSYHLKRPHCKCNNHTIFITRVVITHRHANRHPCDDMPLLFFMIMFSYFFHVIFLIFSFSKSKPFPLNDIVLKNTFLHCLSGNKDSNLIGKT